MNFEKLYSKKYKDLVGFGIVNGLQKQDAEDFVQGVFLELYKKFLAGEVDASQNVEAFLFRLAKWRMTDKFQQLSSAKIRFKEIGEFNDLDNLPAKDGRDYEPLEKAILLAEKTTRPKTFRYWREQINGANAYDLYKKYGISRATAYLAKSRVSKKIVELAISLDKQSVRD